MTFWAIAMPAGQPNNNLIVVNWYTWSLAEIYSKSLNQRQLFFHKKNIINNFFTVIRSILSRLLAMKMKYVCSNSNFVSICYSE
jgi:hypothetical protein